MPPIPPEYSPEQLRASLSGYLASKVVTVFNIRLHDHWRKTLWNLGRQNKCMQAIILMVSAWCTFFPLYCYVRMKLINNRRRMVNQWLEKIYSEVAVRVKQYVPSGLLNEEICRAKEKKKKSQFKMGILYISQRFLLFWI